MNCGVEMANNLNKTAITLAATNPIDPVAADHYSAVDENSRYQEVRDRRDSEESAGVVTVRPENNGNPSCTQIFQQSGLLTVRRHVRRPSINGWGIYLRLSSVSRTKITGRRPTEAGV